MESRRVCFNPAFSSNIAFFGNRDSLFRGEMKPELMDDTMKKRPFFTTSAAEEFYDEEYYDEQLPGKKRRLTPEQVHLLERSFEEDNRLEPDRKSELAKELGLQQRQVAIWFQNRRARWKTKQLEKDYDHLKSSYDSLTANYESILLQNGNLKSEILSLTEKLHANKTMGESIQKKSAPATGSDASVVVNDGCQFIDSDDSYFQDSEYAAAGDDEGYYGGRNFFSDVFVAAQEEQEPVMWGIWS